MGLTHSERLAGVHPDLVHLINTVAAENWDLEILEGVRSKQRQTDLFNSGASKTMDSKHLIQPDGWGHALDYGKVPINWKDTNGFYFLGGYILGVAWQLGVKIRFGGDWNSNRDLHDQTFNDLDHIELLDA